MRAETRDRLLSRRSERGAGPVPELTDGTAEDFLVSDRVARLAAARDFDPQASLDEELLVRLMSDAAGELEGGLGAEGGSLLKPLQEAVSAAVGRPTDLDLTTVSAGSTVLHFRVVADRTEPVASVPVDDSDADEGVRNFLALVSSLEAGEDVRRWADELDGARRLLTVLTKQAWDVDFSWLRLNGGVTHAQLGEAGRQRFADLLTTTERTEEITISGRVTELRESGLVKLKASASRRSAAFEVHVEPTDAFLQRVRLGDQVSLVVNEVTSTDALGRETGRTLRYVRRGAAPLPDLLDELPPTE